MEIRVAQPQDATKITDLVLECYGTLAANQNFYLPELMAYLIQEGKIRVYLAIQDDKVVSMEACESSEIFPKTLFMEGKMTLPSERGKGIAGQVLEKMLSDQGQTDMNSFYAYTKGNTPGIQKMLEKHGFRMTGFLFHDYKDRCSKNSNVVMIRNEGIRDVGDIYVPEHLSDFVKLVYDPFAISYRIRSGRYPCEGKTDVQRIADRNHENLTLVIHHAGRDFKQVIQGQIYEFSKCPMQTYQIYINMKDYSAIYAYQILISMGCTFTGIKPIGSHAEYMIFYYSEKFTIDWKSVILEENQQEMIKWLIQNSRNIQQRQERRGSI